MQKKLIALAIAGLSSAAFAQSNVTIYGVADGTFDVVKSTGATAATSAGEFGNVNRVTSNSSYLGFKGSEDLGNGLKAVFQFETAVDFTNNANAGLGGASVGMFSATRDSFVGVSSGFGTVVLGNLTGPTRALGAAVDVNAGATGIGANSGLLGKLAGGTLNFSGCGKSGTCTSIFDTRWSNAIAYVSPSFSGFQATAAYVANENRTDRAAVANAAFNSGTAPTALSNLSRVNTSGYDVGVNYNNGPILVGLAYNAAKVEDNSDLKVKNLRVAGSYNFGVASVRLLWEKTKAEDNNGAASLIGGDAQQTKYGIGGTFNITPAGKILAQYYLAKDVKGSAGGSDTGAKLWELGYEHALSKRTALKAVYAQINNDDNANFDFGVSAVGIAGASSATNFTNTLGNGVGNGAKVSGIQIGVRHSF